MALPPSSDGRMPTALPYSRLELTSFFASKGFRRGAEIGVECGVFSEQLCRVNPTLDLLCVDAWCARKGYREHVSQAKLDAFYAETVARLQFTRAEILRGWSVDIARTIPDGSLDFVYLDAAHDLASVIADLQAWSPKVRAGGVVAGHDYRSSKGRAGAVFHVKQAVQAWTSAYQIRPWFVLTGDRSPSWLWEQP